MKTVLVFLFSATILAQTYYDYKSGNSYQVNRDRSGTTTRGYNTRTGSIW